MRSVWLFGLLTLINPSARLVAADAASTADANAPIILSTDEMVKIELLNLEGCMDSKATN